MSKYSSDIERLSQQLEELIEQTIFNRRPVTLKSILRGFTFRFFEEYAQWRYEHPYLSKILAIIRFFLIAGLVLIFAWWLAGTSVGKVTGLNNVKSRVTFAYYSVVWASKGVPAVESLQVAPKRFSGTVERVVGDVLIVSYYNQGKSMRRLVRPANVEIVDKKGFAKWAKQYVLKGITIDFYIPIGKASGHDVWAAVLWSKRMPVNVELVELGFGHPQINPETEVVSQIYSMYYLMRAKSG